MRKIVVIIGLIFFLSPGLAQAGCLDDLTATRHIYSKIRGFVSRPDQDAIHYVILDKATCTTGGSDVTLGDYTKSKYYLYFNNDDNFLQSTLLTAYTKGEIVNFRLSTAGNGYNKIAYVVSPSSANNQ